MHGGRIMRLCMSNSSLDDMYTTDISINLADHSVNNRETMRGFRGK